MPSVPAPLGPGAGQQSPQVPQLPANVPATPLNPAARLVQGQITPQAIPLTDWQAAAASYIVLIWMAEVPTLAPVAVALAWGIAITYAIVTNVPLEIAKAVNGGSGGSASTNSNQSLGGQTQTQNPNPSLGEIVGNPGFQP